MNTIEIKQEERVVSKEIQPKIAEVKSYNAEGTARFISFSDSTKSKPRKIKRLIDKTDAGTDSISERIARPFKVYHNRTYLAVEYTLFGLGVGSTAVACIGLNNFIQLVVPFFLLSFWIFMFAGLLAYIAMDKIIYKKLTHKLAPHGFVLYFAICILCALASLLPVALIALLTSSLAATIISWVVLLALSIYLGVILVTKSLHDQ